jgi:hypothetical protein
MFGVVGIVPRLPLLFILRLASIVAPYMHACAATWPSGSEVVALIIMSMGPTHLPPSFLRAPTRFCHTCTSGTLGC